MSVDSLPSKARLLAPETRKDFMAVSALLAKIQWVSLCLVIIAIVLLVVVAMFLLKSWAFAKAIDGNVVAILLTAIGALIAGELLPIVQNVTFDGKSLKISFQHFGEEIVSDIAAIKSRLAELEVERSAIEVFKRSPAPDKLDKPGPYRDDPRKGQFGGKASVDGFTLYAEFPDNRDGDWTTVRLIVKAETPEAQASNVPFVEFYLHNSFNEPRVMAPMVERRANLRLTVWGGFTVGVWIPERDITLELDLALLPYAPRIIKEL